MKACLCRKRLSNWGDEHGNPTIASIMHFPNRGYFSKPLVSCYCEFVRSGAAAVFLHEGAKSCKGLRFR